MKREQPWQEAMFRGAIEAVVVAALMTLTTAQAGLGWSAAFISGGIAGLSVFGARAGYEGIVDQRAARKR